MNLQDIERRLRLRGCWSQRFLHEAVLIPRKSEQRAMGHAQVVRVEELPAHLWLLALVCAC